jgi:hypothetical protein
LSYRVIAVQINNFNGVEIMRRFIAIFLGMVVIVASSALASGLTKEEIGETIVKRGYVSPKTHDSPARLAEHREAVKWMRELTPAQMSDYVKRFHAKTGRGKLVNEMIWEAYINGYEQVINKSLARNLTGVSDTGSFALRGTFKKFNKYVIYLAAGYVDLVVQGLLPKPTAAVAQPSNDQPATKVGRGTAEDALTLLFGNMVTNSNNSPTQAAAQEVIHQTPPATVAVVTQEATIFDASRLTKVFSTDLDMDVFTDPITNKQYLLLDGVYEDITL